MASLGLINYSITFFCLAGLGLSIYSYIVELNAEHDKSYKAMCDISPHMSCTKAFMSEYGKGFGIFGKLFGEDSVLNKPNSLAGILAYSLLATLAQSNAKIITQVSLFFIVVSNLLSLYLAYILYFVLYDLCLVCVGTYVVNLVNLILTGIKYQVVKELESSARTKGKLKKN